MHASLSEDQLPEVATVGRRMASAAVAHSRTSSSEMLGDSSAT